MVDERTQHVWRQRNEDDEDVWLDIMRVDDWPSSKGQQNTSQKTTYHFEWENEDLPLEHPTRDVEMLDVANPEDDAQIVPVPVIKKYQSHNSDQKITHSFVNGEATETRIYSVRRVYHRDTVTDPPVDGADYQVDPETIDEQQYVDVALIESIVTASGQGETFQKATHHYSTELIEQFSVPAPGDYDETKVVHLDPFQNIVNVQWGGDNYFAAITATEGWALLSPDGVTWETKELPYGSEYEFEPSDISFARSCSKLLIGGYIHESFDDKISYLLESDDGGRTWSEIDLAEFTAVGAPHPYDNNELVALRYDRDPKILTAYLYYPFFSSGFPEADQELSNQVLRMSEDGTSWSQQSLVQGGSGNHWADRWDLDYLTPVRGNLVIDDVSTRVDVRVTDIREAWVEDAFGTTYEISFDQGSTWQKHSISGFGIIYRIAVGNNVMVAVGTDPPTTSVVGDTNLVAISSNGTTWETVRTSDFSSQMVSVAFASGRFCAVGSTFVSGFLFTSWISFDGASWEQTFQTPSNAGARSVTAFRRTET